MAASQADLFQAHLQDRFPADGPDVDGERAHLLSQEAFHVVSCELKRLT